MLRLADIAYTFRFLRLLTTNWKDTNAFKQGIVDENGNVLRRATSSEDKKVYNSFHRLVFNIKRLLNRIPFGRTRIASYAAALYLLKEETGLSDDKIRKILNEATGVKLEDLTEEEIPTGWLNLNEAKNNSYVLTRDILSPINAEVVARENSQVRILSEDTNRSIFGIPVFEAIHLKSRSKIFVTPYDVTQ